MNPIGTPMYHRRFDLDEWGLSGNKNCIWITLFISRCQCWRFCCHGSILGMMYGAQIPILWLKLIIIMHKVKVAWYGGSQLIWLGMKRNLLGFAIVPQMPHTDMNCPIQWCWGKFEKKHCENPGAGGVLVHCVLCGQNGADALAPCVLCGQHGADALAPCVLCGQHRADVLAPCVLCGQNGADALAPCVLCGQHGADALAPCVLCGQHRADVLAPCVLCGQHRADVLAPCVLCDQHGADALAPCVLCELSVKEIGLQCICHGALHLWC